MNRRAFLALALAGCTASLVGCGRQSQIVAAEGTLEATVEAAPQATAVATSPVTPSTSSSVLHAPPLAAKPNPINETAQQIPTRIEIPTIKVDTAVVELGWSSVANQEGQIFSEWDVAAYAAGWHKNSALPGTGGNVVLSGHNNILGAVFRELDQLKRGDPITVWMNNRVYHYRVDQVIVLPDRNITDEQRVKNAAWIGPFDDERLTLVSCWPRNNNTHRIVVIARPELIASQ